MKLIKPSNKVQEKVLEICNKIRKLYGCKPLEGLPEGVPLDPCRCPICKSLPTGEEILSDGEHLLVYSKKDAEKISSVFRNRIFEEKQDDYYVIKAPSAFRSFWERFDSLSPHYKKFVSDEKEIDYEADPEEWFYLLEKMEKP